MERINSMYIYTAKWGKDFNFDKSLGSMLWKAKAISPDFPFTLDDIKGF